MTAKKLANVYTILAQPPRGVHVSYDKLNDCLSIRLKRPTAVSGLLIVLLYSLTALAFLGIEWQYNFVYKLSCQLWTHHYWLSPRSIAWIHISFCLACLGLLSIPFTTLCALKRAVIEISTSMIVARGLQTTTWKTENVEGITVSSGLAFRTHITPHSKATQADTAQQYLHIHMTNLTRKEREWLSQVFLLVLSRRDK